MPSRPDLQFSNTPPPPRLSAPQGPPTDHSEPVNFFAWLMVKGALEQLAIILAASQQDCLGGKFQDGIECRS